MNNPKQSLPPVSRRKLLKKSPHTHICHIQSKLQHINLTIVLAMVEVHVLDDYYLAITLLITIAYQLFFFSIAFSFKFDKLTGKCALIRATRARSMADSHRFCWRYKFCGTGHHHTCIFRPSSCTPNCRFSLHDAVGCSVVGVPTIPHFKDRQR